MCPVTLAALGIGGTAAASAGAGAAAAAAGAGAVAGTAATAAIGAGAVAGTATAAGAATAGGLTITQMVGLGLTLATGALSAFSAHSAAAAQSKALKEEAKLKEQAARDAVERGNVESTRRRLAGRRTQAEQAARMAANGVDINQGSALDILDETLLTTEEDAFSIRSNALREGTGFAQQASNARTNAGVAKRSGLFDGVGTVLTTGSRVASQFKSFTSAPGFA